MEELPKDRHLGKGASGMGASESSASSALAAAARALAGQAAGIVLAVLALAVAGRATGVEGLAALGIFGALLVPLHAGLDLGLGTVVLATIARTPERERAVIRAGLRLRWRRAGVAGLLLAAVAGGLFCLGASATLVLPYAFAAALAPTLVPLLQQAALQRRQRLGGLALSGVLSRILLLIAFLLLAWNQAHWSAFLAATALREAGLALFGAWLGARSLRAGRGPAPAREELSTRARRALARRALTFGLSGAGEAVLRAAPLVALGSAAGIYTAAWRPLAPLLTIPGVLGGTLVPWLAERGASPAGSARGEALGPRGRFPRGEEASGKAARGFARAHTRALAAATLSAPALYAVLYAAGPILYGAGALAEGVQALAPWLALGAFPVTAGVLQRSALAAKRRARRLAQACLSGAALAGLVLAIAALYGAFGGAFAEGEGALAAARWGACAWGLGELALLALVVRGSGARGYGALLAGLLGAAGGVALLVQTAHALGEEWPGGSVAGALVCGTVLGGLTLWQLRGAALALRADPVRREHGE